MKNYARLSTIKCPLCQSGGADHKLIHARYQIYECQLCQLQFLSPIPTQIEIRNFYTKSYFYNKSSTIFGYKNYTGLTKCLTAEAIKKIPIIKKYAKGKKLLDAGSGTGIFAQVAQNTGFKVFANDISTFVKNELRKKNIPCLFGPLEKINTNERFDIITAWDMVEHIPDIQMMATSFNKLLKKGGYLFITTPNTKSIDTRFLGKRGYIYKRVPEHVVFLNPKSITKLLENNGFKIIKIMPWGFVRDLDFIAGCLKNYSPLFASLGPLFKFLRISKKSFFFPMIDCLVIAKKINK